jgi:signal recognition particle receptor subunit beta
LRKNIRKSNKIVLIGPSEAGKTTINKVFFEMDGPRKLLNSPPEPTKGVDLNKYSFYKKNIEI